MEVRGASDAGGVSVDTLHIAKGGGVGLYTLRARSQCVRIVRYFGCVSFRSALQAFPVVILYSAVFPNYTNHRVIQIQEDSAGLQKPERSAQAHSPYKPTLILPLFILP